MCSLSKKQQVKVLDVAKMLLSDDDTQTLCELVSGAIVEAGFANYVICSWVDIRNYIPAFTPNNLLNIYENEGLRMDNMVITSGIWDEMNKKNIKCILKSLRRNILE